MHKRLHVSLFLCMSVCVYVCVRERIMFLCKIKALIEDNNVPFNNDPSIFNFLII